MNFGAQVTTDRTLSDAWLFEKDYSRPFPAIRSVRNRFQFLKMKKTEEPSLEKFVDLLALVIQYRRAYFEIRGK